MPVAECLLDPMRLRGVLALVGFGTVLLWVALADYTTSDGGNRGSVDAGLGVESRIRDSAGHHVNSRHLLEIGSLRDSNDSDDSANTPSYDPSSVDCASIHKLSQNDSKCAFIQTVEKCQPDGGFNYLHFVYCSMPFRLIPLSMIILVGWLVFLFLFLGATAEDYFCPSLKVMSQVMHLSQNVAGVTLLALGNGAPDIFSAYAAINQKDDHQASLAFGALFGAGMFVTTVVVGGVALATPFSLTQRPFLRDIIFYLGAVFWTFYLLWVGHVNIGNAAGFIALYVFYVFVVIVGRIVYQKLIKKKQLGTGDIPSPILAPSGKELAVSDHDSASGRPNTDTNTQPPQQNGLYGFQNTAQSSEEEEMEEEGGGAASNVRAPRIMIDSIGSSAVSGEPTVATARLVPSSDEDSSSEDEVSKRNTFDEGSSNVQSHRGGSRLPIFPFPVPGAGLAPPPHALRRRAESNEQRREASPTPKLMRKTISGALDLTEEVGAAVGIPHVSQIWEEVHRTHSCTAYEEEQETALTQAESDDSETTPFINQIKVPKRPHPFVKMLQGVWPFGQSFKDLGYVGKAVEIVKFPITVVLALTVPVVDTAEDDHNWNKWLNVFHVVSGPVCIILVTRQGLIMIGGVFPVVLIILIVATFVAIAVACTSQCHKPPRYHCVFAWLGFAVAVVWIYSIANEIVNVLQTFGVVMQLSSGILGLTLLAWGNSIGDAVSNVTMARQGFPRMAIGACFGGPLLNMLLGVGVASLIKSARRKDSNFTFPLYFTPVQFLASIFLILSLVSSLVVISLLKFKLRRPYGVYLLVLYVSTLLITILAEFKVFTILDGVLSPSVD